MPKINPPLPSLILGLGGSGALTVYHAKQQLYEMYNNRVPPSVGLLVVDTAREPLAQFSRAGEAREEGMGFGEIEFGTREMCYLGGDATSLLTRAAKADAVRAGYLSSWLQAEYYLETLPETIRRLEDGAGMYRQLGRLALFRDVASPADSRFYNSIREKITTIKSNTPGDTRSLLVFIVGSLAGGTGAGLFLDAAYLVRKIAAQANMDVQIRGYFYLPDAFSSTLPSSDRNSARARAMGALRELSRFILHEDWGIGYPITYHPPNTRTNEELWNSALTSKLYDLVYAVDGHRERNNLTEYPLALGVTPSVADAMMGFMDSGAGEYQRTYIVNLAVKINEAHLNIGKVPFIGAFGTYTIILPIQQIVEGWAFQLALDALELVLAPTEYDENTHIPRKLDARANRERSYTPQEEVKTILTSRNDIIDPRPGKDHLVRPTATWAHIYRFHDQYRSGTADALIARLGRADLADWTEYFLPGQDDQSPAVKTAWRNTARTRDTTVRTKIKPSDELEHKEEPDQGAHRIASQTERLFEDQLGPVREGGRRQGGKYREALKEFVKVQVDRFRDGVATYVVGQLYGQHDRDYVEARAGKLPWTIAVLREWDEVLTDVVEVMEKVRTRTVGNQSPRAQAVNALEAARKEMFAQREETGGIGRFFGRSKALASQDNYISAAEHALEMYRAEIAREAFTEVLEDTRSFLQSAVKNLENWQEVLATDTNSLYSRVYRGQQQVKTQRHQAAKIPARRVIDDEAWEAMRYAHYKGEDENSAIQQMLGALYWDTRIEQDDKGKPRLRITLKLDREEGRGLSARTWDMIDERLSSNQRWSLHNFTALMEFCREVFRDALERESVLNYLSTREYAGRPKDLAEELYLNSGILLRRDRVETEQTVPANYLLAYQNPNQPEETTFLESVLDELKAFHNVSARDQALTRSQNADDPFRLTLVNMEEMIPLNRIKAYNEQLDIYQKATTQERMTYHIFPAEVNSVRYEDRLPHVLAEAKRIIQDRVAVLLEDKNRFKQFLTLMAYGIIRREVDHIQYERDMSTRYVYYLSLMPDVKKARPDKGEIWWLTESQIEPSLIDAMTTYIYIGKDVGYQEYSPGYTSTIKYNQVNEYLREKRAEETEKRVTFQALAADDEEMQQWFKNFESELRREIAKQEGMDPDDIHIDDKLQEHERYQDITYSIVEHDVLKEFSQVLRHELPGMKETLEQFKTGFDEAGERVDRPEEQTLKERYDLYCMAVIGLEEEIEAKRKEVARKAGVLSAIGTYQT